MQKREKRRWIFRKPTVHVQQCEATKTATTAAVTPVLGADQRHAIAVATATAAAAEAAVATAQAAVEIVRLTRPNNFVKEHFAATLIQTAFRGYLVSTIYKTRAQDHEISYMKVVNVDSFVLGKKSSACA